MTTHTRYYAASDGTYTVFRGTGRPDGFKFASWTNHPDGWVRSIGFHNAYKPFCHPAIQISRAEYRALTAAKMERFKGSTSSYDGSSPQDCWVKNADVEVQAYLAAIRVKDAAEGIE